LSTYNINLYFKILIKVKNNIFIYFLGFFSFLFDLWNPLPSLSYGFFANPNFLSLKLFSLLFSLFLPTNSFFLFLFRESSFTLPICVCVSLDSALILANSHTRWVLRFFICFLNFSSCVTSISDFSCCFRCLCFVAATQTQMQLELWSVFLLRSVCFTREWGMEKKAEFFFTCSQLKQYFMD